MWNARCSDHIRATISGPLADEYDNLWRKEAKPPSEVLGCAPGGYGIVGRLVAPGTTAHDVAVCDVLESQAALGKRKVVAMHGPLGNEAV